MGDASDDKAELASLASEPPVNVDEIFESLHTNMAWLVQGSKQHGHRIAENSELAKAAATQDALAAAQKELTQQREEAMAAMQTSFDEKLQQMDVANEQKLDAALRQLEWKMQEQVEQRCGPVEQGFKDMKERLSKAEQALSQLVNMPAEERFKQIDVNHDGSVSQAPTPFLAPPSPWAA